MPNLSQEEAQRVKCEAAGGVWINGSCSKIISASLKLARGNPCHNGEMSVVVKRFNPADRRALADLARRVSK